MDLKASFQKLFGHDDAPPDAADPELDASAAQAGLQRRGKEFYDPKANASLPATGDQLAAYLNKGDSAQIQAAQPTGPVWSIGPHREGRPSAPAPAAPQSDIESTDPAKFASQLGLKDNGSTYLDVHNGQEVAKSGGAGGLFDYIKAKGNGGLHAGATDIEATPADVLARKMGFVKSGENYVDPQTKVQVAPDTGAMMAYINDKSTGKFLPRPEVADAPPVAPGPSASPVAAATQTIEAASPAPVPAYKAPEALPTPAAPAPQAPAKPVDDEEMKAAQARDNRTGELRDMANNLNEATNLIIHRPDYQRVQHAGGENVRDLLARRDSLRKTAADKRESDLYDLNSDTSQRATQLFRAKGLIGPQDRVTAAEANDVFKGASLEEARRNNDLKAKEISQERDRQDRAQREQEAYHNKEIELGYAKLNQDKNGARADKENERVDHDTARLEKDEEKSASLIPDIQTLVKATKAPENGIDGVGRYAGSNLVPDWLRSDSGRETRQAAQRALLTIAGANRWNKDRTDMMARQYGIAPGQTEAEFRAGVPKLLEAARGAMKRAEAGHMPEAVQRLRERGGTTSADLENLDVEAPSTTKSPASAPAAAAPSPAPSVSEGDHPLPVSAAVSEPTSATVPVGRHGEQMAIPHSTPAPHGDVVQQDGKTFKWNGQMYKRVG